MARVLILLDHPAAYREFRPVAGHLVEHGHEVTFLVDAPAGALVVPPADRELFEFSGLVDRPEPAQSDAADANDPGARGKAFTTSYAGAVVLFLSAVRRYAQNLWRYKREISRVSPRAVIVGGDRRFPTEIAFLAAARSKGIFALIAPYADSEPEDIAFNRHQDHGLILGRPELRALKALVARRWPGQTYGARYGEVLFYHPAMVLALGLFRALPRRPWVIGGSGLASHVAVAARTDRNLCAELGLDSRQVSLTGRASFDEIFQRHGKRAEIRAELEARYRLEPGRKLVIASLAQRYAEYEGWSEPDHRGYVDVLKKSGANVLLSIHPKESRATYPYIEEAPNMRFMSDPLMQGLAGADVFVAPISSTLRWALLLGIPCLTVEPTVHALPPHNQSNFAPLCRSMAEFEKGLRTLLTDREEYEIARKRLERIRMQDFPFDGLATARIVELLPLGEGVSPHAAGVEDHRLQVLPNA